MTNRWKSDLLSYPLTQAQLDSGACKDFHSCILPNDPRVLFHPKDGPKPLHPEDGALFWDEFLEVAHRVDMARRKVSFSRVPSSQLSQLWPEHVFGDDSEFIAEPIKEAYNVRTAYDLAMLVKSDWPTDIMSKMAGWLYSKGYKQRELFSYKYTRFTDGPVCLASIIGQLIHKISPTMFAHKWYHGRMRPQQVAHQWAKGELEAPHGIDLALSKIIDRDAVAKDETNFGIYGMPPHPSFPAMHSSVAAKHILFAVWFELDDAAFKQLRKSGYNVAVGRDFGGVHYRSDDLFGLDAGERAISMVLPQVLEDVGADSSQVSEIISQYRTDWTKGIF